MAAVLTTHGKRDLRLLAAAAFMSSAGDFLALITLALAVHEASGSALVVSAFFATTMVPTILLAPLAGSVADRFESVHVMAAASVAQAVTAAALAFTSGDVAAVLALSALLTAGSAISQPAEFALIPHLASDDELTRANGLMEAARYAGYTVGPLVAAGLVAAGGTRLALLLNAVSFLAIAVAAALVRTRRGSRGRPGSAPAEAAAAPERARDGAAVLLADPVLRATLIAAVAALLFVAASLTAEVFYVKDVLGAGDLAYAVVVAAWMIGMVFGALRLAPRVAPAAAATTALAALVVQGAGVGAATAWVVLPAAIVGYAIGGMGHGVKNPLLRTLIQVRVPARVHGRAFAAYNAARNTAEVAALAGGGLLVAAVGARYALLVAGAGTVVAGAAGLLALRRLSRPTRFALTTREPTTEVH